jgi:hypothetical protein
MGYSLGARLLASLVLLLFLPVVAAFLLCLAVLLPLLVFLPGVNVTVQGREY